MKRILLALLAVVVFAGAVSANDTMGACIAVRNNRSQTIVISLILPSTYAGARWTLTPGRDVWLMSDDTTYIMSTVSESFNFSISEGGTALDGDNKFVNWTYDASDRPTSRPNSCNGTWSATVHD